MPLLGAHTSMAGGLHLAFQRLGEIRGEALQLFVKNERQWKAPPLSPQTVELFHKAWQESGNIPVAVHDAYLINLSAADDAVLEKSIAAFSDELSRCATLGIPYLITHPGSHVGQGTEEGLKSFVLNLDKAIDLSETLDVSVLIETTAGQGTQLGSTFEEIAFILNSSRHGRRLGVCYDTCHTFAAGYDIRDAAAYEATFSRFHDIVGLERMKFFHLNDSKKELGSRVDRHESIGEGKIGLEGFRLLVNDPRFEMHPMVLETPKKNGLEEDKKNLGILRACLSQQDV